MAKKPPPPGMNISDLSYASPPFRHKSSSFMIVTFVLNAIHFECWMELSFENLDECLS